MLFLFLGIFE